MVIKIFLGLSQLICNPHLPNLISTIKHHSAASGSCRNNLCGLGRTIQSNTGTKSGSCQSSVGDLHAPTWENTLFKSWGKLETQESNSDHLFFQSPDSVGFSVCHPREKGSLCDRIQVQGSQHNCMCELTLFISFILVMALRKTSNKATKLQLVAVILRLA